MLWEFTSDDMGYTIPQPTMGQLAGGSWVAMIPNGYDSTEQEGKLVVLDLKQGTPISVLQTNASFSGKLNGLSTPVPVDLDGDRKTDLLYAGDLLGNLWRFDVRSSDSTARIGQLGSSMPPASIPLAPPAIGNPLPHAPW